jgi:hypothetical protein
VSDSAFGDGLMRMDSDSRCMEHRELRHNRYTVLLLTDHMWNIGAAKPNAEEAIARSLYIQLRGLVTLGD